MDVWYIPTFGRILWQLYVNNTSEMDPKGFEISQFSVKPEKRRKTGQCPASVNHPPVLRQRLHLQNMCCCVFFFLDPLREKNRDRCSFLVHFKSLNISYLVFRPHIRFEQKIKNGFIFPMFWAKKQAPAHLQESKC